MKMMNPDSLLRTYNKISIVVGLILMIVLVTYFGKIPVGMYGPIEKGLFSTVFTVALNTEIVVFNVALLFAIIAFLFHVGVLIIVFNKKTTEKAIQESVLYNVILSIGLILTLIIFYLNIPANVNGEIFIGFFQYKFNVLSDVIVGGFNFAYIVTTIYVFLNIAIAFISSRSYELVEVVEEEQQE
ncbi:MAG: hypothetical protein JXR62_03815 [Bacilli bacterium]|nr:hypothetical protein [Bacilli bacterium]